MSVARIERAPAVRSAAERRAFSSPLGAHGLGMVGLLLFGTIVAVALIAPLVMTVGPFDLGRDRFAPPSERYWFGTDNIGRDVLVGVVHGARTSLVVAVASTLIAVVIGCIVGAVSGFYGGLVDDALMRTSEVFQSVPRLVLALVIVALFGANLAALVAVIGILSWPDIARVLRSQFLSLREREFVLAARACGTPDARIIFREILPNALPPVIVAASLLLASSILLEAGLAYLGLSDPQSMSWGKMLNNSQLFLRRAWWLAFFPGAAILITSLGAALAADLLNDILDPRRKTGGRHKAKSTT